MRRAKTVSLATRDNRILRTAFRSWYVTAASLQSGCARSAENFANIHGIPWWQTANFGGKIQVTCDMYRTLVPLCFCKSLCEGDLGNVPSEGQKVAKVSILYRTWAWINSDYIHSWRLLLQQLVNLGNVLGKISETWTLTTLNSWGGQKSLEWPCWRSCTQFRWSCRRLLTRTSKFTHLRLNARFSKRLRILIMQSLVIESLVFQKDSRVSKSVKNSTGNVLAVWLVMYCCY